MSLDGQDGPVTEADLHAWLDGELPSSRWPVVEAHLDANPEDLERIEAYRRHKDMLRRVFAIPPEPAAVPAAATLEPAPRRSWRRLAGAAAAAMLLVVGGAAGGWFARGAMAPAGPAPATARFVADAVTAHEVYVAEVRHPVEVAADQEAHLVTWLSKRLGAPLSAPSLAAAGFQLVGGRLLPGAVGPAAQFMYEDGGGRRITLYVRPHAAADSAFRLAEQGRVSAFHWEDKGLAWALLGEIDRAALLDLAHKVYDALDS
jgi:anti-sigma factor RsiW